MVWRQFVRKVRFWLLDRGYTCDACGVELFDYPQNRLCESCQEKLRKAEGTVCEKCGRKTLTQGVCQTCKSCLPIFSRGFAPYVYKAECASVVNRIKTGAPRLAYHFGERMAEYFADRYKPSTEEEISLVPVPVTKRRLRTRGYNQAQRLAIAVGKRLVELGFKVEIRKDFLVKRRETPMQKHMNAKQRRENVSGAYQIRKRKNCKGKKILLIDDIITTGATASECAKRLMSAGATEVLLLVAAALPERKG